MQLRLSLLRHAGEINLVLLPKLCIMVVVKTPEVQANAKFIVKACNAHDFLLEACKEMSETICRLCKRLNPQHENCTSCEEMEGYKQAITKGLADL